MRRASVGGHCEVNVAHVVLTARRDTVELDLDLRVAVETLQIRRGTVVGDLRGVIFELTHGALAWHLHLDRLTDLEPIPESGGGQVRD